MRLRFNGFDALVLVFIVALAALLVHSELKHASVAATAGLGPTPRTVVFSITTMPTQYAQSVMSHMQVGGQVSVQAGGNFVPLGTLQSVSEHADTFTVNNGTGVMVVTSDPTEGVLRLIVAAKAVVNQKTVTINGNAFYVDQHAVFHEGGSEFDGVITDEQVR